MDTVANPFLLHFGQDAEDTTKPPHKPYRGPIFINDAITPCAGTTLLLQQWRKADDGKD